MSDSIISYKEWEENYLPIHADMIDFLMMVLLPQCLNLEVLLE